MKCIRRQTIETDLTQGKYLLFLDRNLTRRTRIEIAEILRRTTEQIKTRKEKIFTGIRSSTGRININ
jgi:hypothetical protein